MQSKIDFEKKYINISTDRCLQNKEINIFKHDTNWKNILYTTTNGKEIIAIVCY